MREQKSEGGTGRFDIGRSRAAFAAITAAELHYVIVRHAHDTKCQQSDNKLTTSSHY